ncbi:EFR3-like protein, partial [Nymphaea thermarum]
PVKRYKKLLADIFPKNLDDPPNERKITKLCEYAAKNPFRVPKIAKYLERRSYKELRSEHFKLMRVIMETYNKLLCLCKGQMPYFAANLLNVVNELLDYTHGDEMQILGCQTLTNFIYSQADGTYTHNIESLVCKICTLARDDGEGFDKKSLRAASLQCLSAMVWFMAEFSHIFSDFDEIVYVVLDNYGADTHHESDEQGETHHNRVNEVVRWNDQLILAAIIRHLDHKNVAHDLRVKSSIIQIVTALAQQFRSRALVAEAGVVSDLCRHLRKSLQATDKSVGLEESNANLSLQSSIEDCLLEISKRISDARLLFDMMAIALEKLPSVAVVARATVGSMMILAHIISLVSFQSYVQQVYPEALLLQLLKAMIHPDAETRLIAHRIFTVLLVLASIHARHDCMSLHMESVYEPRRLHSRTASIFSSASKLFEKLRSNFNFINFPNAFLDFCLAVDIKILNVFLNSRLSIDINILNVLSDFLDLQHLRILILNVLSDFLDLDLGSPSYKELRSEHFKLMRVIMETYNKLLCLCKGQMPYFAANLLNVVNELLDYTRGDEMQILGCQTLTNFIYSQVDGTYTHNIESLVCKICTLAHEDGEGFDKKSLRAASLQCLSAMVWFMAEFSHIFSDFDEIVYIVLDNYGADTPHEGDEQGETHHNRVNEVVRWNDQLILAAIIRHLDHKNVAHDLRVKSSIIQIVTALAQQFRSRALVAEAGVVSDLCRHLRKSLQATDESVGLEESNANLSLQSSIEDCLLEISKRISDARLLFDMMAIALEKLPSVAVVARATVGSMLILAHIISLVSFQLYVQQVYPKALLLQLLKAMIHPDTETRLITHRIFTVLLVPASFHARHDCMSLHMESVYEPRRLHSRTTSIFS